jgi:hypothetical protein
MFQGFISKRTEKLVASAATIEANADILVITGSVAIVNILPKTFGVASQKVTIIPLAALTCTAAGNIAVAVTFVVNRAQELTFSKTQNKWYPSIAAV